ncbi:unnamed protein product [Trichobilharzia regenti]|nr:unnamed protein product [Trichobilharzia regenti]
MGNILVGYIKILISDMNAKLGADDTGKELIMSRQALDKKDDKKSRRGADVVSVHHLIQRTFKVKLKSFGTSGDRPLLLRFNIQKLKDKTTDQITAKSETLRGITEEFCEEEHWNSLNVGDAQGNVYNHSRKKEETRHGMDDWLSTDTYLQANRGEDASERDDSIGRWTREGEAEFNVHCTE